MNEVYTLSAAPAIEPVTVAEAKLAARFDGSDLDAVIAGYIATARKMAEQETSRCFIEQTWRLTLTEWPDDGVIELRRGPLLTVSAVETWNGSAWVALATSAYVVVPGQFYASVHPALNTSWPSLVDAVGPRVRVTFTAGYGANATTVPENVKTWIKAQVAYWIRNPEAAFASPGLTAAVVSPFLGALLDSERAWS